MSQRSIVVNVRRQAVAHTVRDVTKKWKLGALSLIIATIAVASLVSAPLAATQSAAQGITVD